MTSRELNLLQFSAREITVASYVGAYMFELSLYGLYTLLFIFCAHIIWLYRKPNHWVFFTLVTLMFGIVTADVAVTLHSLFGYILKGRSAPDPYPRVLFFITNNIIADSLLIYRSYIIWSHKKRLIIIPSVLLCCSSVCGYVFANPEHFHKRFRIYMWMTFGQNVCLTLLIAGRLFWSARRARTILGPEVIRIYNSLCPILVESGAIYSSYLLADLVSHSNFLNAGRHQIVGIVPTLIISRISLGRSVQDELTHDAGTSSTPVLDSIFSTIGTVAQFTPHSPRGDNNGIQPQLPQQEEATEIV
ncbi:hypothetical protein GALMADRAFT_230217 [Galerina marginata CBS 339.88]|uniref:Integral membrane protein n=1 Tax=Galerina marginata (strain CBS 339.88) TaxID=685588 RepID=A0A067SH07_GALM3|nr:hypothetical protein GALMADRAFT_230217 [Galerina marginata CBS 339.88]